jgi:8-oxo-dGTP pyrophosphatase MutT (NUDIX family)
MIGASLEKPGDGRRRARTLLAVDVSLSLQRLGYRSAYRALQVYWFFLRRSSRGVKCVLIQGDYVLLVRHTYGPSHWELPGGGMHRGEEPVAAARREMNEELGLEIDNWKRQGTTVVEVDHHHDRVEFLTAELSAPQLTLNEAELSDARWFPRRELPPDLGRYARTIIASLPEG